MNKTMEPCGQVPANAPKRKGFLFYLFLAVVLLTIDQVTKYWVQTVLQSIGMIDVIDGVLSFTYVRNYGAAFGMLEGQKWLLLILTIVILAGGIWFFLRNKLTNPWLLSGGAAVLAGAMGNLIDRFRLSYVIDFIEVRFISFPVFNIADCCVVIGMLILGICILRGKTT